MEMKKEQVKRYVIIGGVAGGARGGALEGDEPFLARADGLQESDEVADGGVERLVGHGAKCAAGPGRRGGTATLLRVRARRAVTRRRSPAAGPSPGRGRGRAAAVVSDATERIGAAARGSQSSPWMVTA